MRNVSVSVMEMLVEWNGLKLCLRRSWKLKCWIEKKLVKECMEGGKCLWVMEVNLSGQFNMKELFWWGLACWVSFARVWDMVKFNTLGVINKLREFWGTIEYRKLWILEVIYFFHNWYRICLNGRFKSLMLSLDQQ